MNCGRDANRTKRPAHNEVEMIEITCSAIYIEIAKIERARAHANECTFDCNFHAAITERSINFSFPNQNCTKSQARKLADVKLSITYIFNLHTIIYRPRGRAGEKSNGVSKCRNCFGTNEPHKRHLPTESTSTHTNTHTQTTLS